MKKLLLAIVALTLGLSANQVAAQGTLKNKFLHNFASAMVVEARCKALKVNPAMAMPAMEGLHIKFDDISPGGADWPAFQQDIQEAQANVAELDDDAVCKAGERMFGPNGVVAPGLMHEIARSAP